MPARVQFGTVGVGRGDGLGRRRRSRSIEVENPVEAHRHRNERPRDGDEPQHRQQQEGALCKTPPPVRLNQRGPAICPTPFTKPRKPCRPTPDSPSQREERHHSDADGHRSGPTPERARPARMVHLRTPRGGSVRTVISQGR
eukprot:scaffold3581_cov252-Pinguiococcus_pyrenoidosus.AAC.11